MSILLRVVPIIFVTIGLILLFGINPAGVEEAIMSLFIRKRLTDEVNATNEKLNFFQKNFRKTGKKLENLKNDMENTDRKGSFSYACIAAIFCMIAGIVVGFLLDNWSLGIVLGCIFCILPFKLLGNMVESYQKSLRNELEMSLNVITMAYIRDENLIAAVDSVIPNLKSPVKEIFEDFSNQIHFVEPSIKKAIKRIRGQIDDPIFREWCDNLLLCQDDMDQVNNLLNIVHKYSEQNLVNQKLQTALKSGKLEFKAMVGFLLGNIALLFIIEKLMNNGWFELLFTTTFGKIVLTIDALILFIGILVEGKIIKPIYYEY